MKQAAMVIAAVLFVGCIVWGGYWVAKTVSYTFFYESMVEQTIYDMVKADALK